MSDTHPSSNAPRVPRRIALVSLLAAASLAMLPSCGGGGGGTIGGVDTGGTGSFTTGRISGFGSVIVNGVRFDDNLARIADGDDDSSRLGPLDLKLGMVVRVQAGTISAGSGDTLPSATATAITVESQIKGPVESKTAPDTLVVFGQVVKVDATTVFEPGVTFAGIAVGDALEVSGFLDANGVTAATRIERENTPNEFKVRGVVADHDPAARTFRIGAARFNYAGATRLPAAALANGQFVRVRTQPARNADGTWVALRIDARDLFDDRDEARVEGILVRNGTLLQVNGLTIDTSRLPAAAALPVGQRVEVEGAIVGGQLVARKIELEDGNSRAEADVRGTATSVNTTAQTFVVRGLTFHYTAATRQDDGTIAADLRDGATVRVRGTVPAGGAGNIEATRIDFRP